MKYRFVVLLFILIGTVFCAYKIASFNTERRALKEDLIELSKIKYGLFSVDEWKNILAGIITKKIEELRITNSNREEMYGRVSNFLYNAIDDYEKRLRRDNEKKFFTFFHNEVNSIFMGKLRKEIPNFSRQIVGFLDDPQNRKAIRKYILAKLDEYTDKTFSKIDYTEHDRIIKAHNKPDKHDTINHLVNQIAQTDNKLYPYKVAIGLLIVACIVFLLFSRNLTNGDFVLLTIVSFTLLSTGLFLPMIEIDARISEIKFTLIGEPVSFQDQVLYYKSKSILQVVNVMLTQGRIDLILVGFLVLLFSVLFPLLKLVSSLLFINYSKLRSSNFIKFMVFKTGKWSMADVMVIAIFMSYIGFSGIITEQLKQIETITRTMEVLTTNKSSLMSGFYFFTSFALLSLLISHKLQYGSKGQSVT